MQALARHGRHPRVQVLAEAVALRSGGPRVPHEVEGLERPESAEQFAHLKGAAQLGYAGRDVITTKMLKNKQINCVYDVDVRNLRMM